MLSLKAFVVDMGRVTEPLRRVLRTCPQEGTEILGTVLRPSSSLGSLLAFRKFLRRGRSWGGC